MSFRRILSLALLALLPALPVATAHAAGPSFADLFADTTLRVDLNHTGNADEEIVALDRLHLDGPWAGPA